jgi:hypothetical protein
VNRLSNAVPFVLALTLSTLVAGCGRGDNGDPFRGSPPPQGAGGGAVPPAEDHAIESPATLTFVVQREDSNGGIAAEIDKLDGDNHGTWFADVPDSGRVSLTKSCSADDRFQADPKVKDFLRGPPQGCATTVRFTLYSTATTLNLIRKADSAAEQGQLLVAQANYGLAADRLQYVDPQQASHLRLMAATAAARVLGLQSATATDNGAELSEELGARLKDYQRSARLEETGVLDAATRAAFVGSDSEALRKEAAAQPAPPANQRLESRVSAGVLKSVPLAPNNAVRLQDGARIDAQLLDRARVEGAQLRR